MTPLCACVSVRVKLRLIKGEEISDAASIHCAPFQSEIKDRFDSFEEYLQVWTQKCRLPTCKEDLINGDAVRQAPYHALSARLSAVGWFFPAYRVEPVV